MERFSRRGFNGLGFKAAGFVALGAVGVACSDRQPTVTPRPKAPTAAPIRIIMGLPNSPVSIVATREPTAAAEFRKRSVTLAPDAMTSIKYGTLKNATGMRLRINRGLMDEMCEDPTYKLLQIGVERTVGVSVILEPGILGKATRPVDRADLAALKEIHRADQGFDMNLQGIGLGADGAFSEVLKRNVPLSFRQRALGEELSLGWVGVMIKGVDLAHGVQRSVMFTPEQRVLIIGSASLPIDVEQVPQEYWDKAKVM